MTRRYENPSWNQGPADLSDFDHLTIEDMEADQADADCPGCDGTGIAGSDQGDRAGFSCRHCNGNANRPARRFADTDTVVLPNDRTATILGATWGDGEWIYEVRQRHTAGTFRYAEHKLEAAR